MNKKIVFLVLFCLIILSFTVSAGTSSDREIKGSYSATDLNVDAKCIKAIENAGYIVVDDSALDDAFYLKLYGYYNGIDQTDLDIQFPYEEGDSTVGKFKNYDFGPLVNITMAHDGGDEESVALSVNYAKGIFVEQINFSLNYLGPLTFESILNLNTILASDIGSSLVDGACTVHVIAEGIDDCEWAEATDYAIYVAMFQTIDGIPPNYFGEGGGNFRDPYPRLPRTAWADGEFNCLKYEFKTADSGGECQPIFNQLTCKI